MSTRRNLLRSLPLAGAALLMRRASGQQYQGSLSTANGGTEPYPIPWLDKNGSHNQPAGPNLEPSHIYHFKGLVARASTFSGMGADNMANRIVFGTPTTDFGLMQGEYWAARTTHLGNEGPIGHRSAPLAGAGCDRYSSPDDIQDSMEIDRGTSTLREPLATILIHWQSRRMSTRSAGRSALNRVLVEIRPA
jgi:hypothetical protein